MNEIICVLAHAFVCFFSIGDKWALIDLRYWNITTELSSETNLLNITKMNKVTY